MFGLVAGLCVLLIRCEVDLGGRGARRFVIMEQEEVGTLSQPPSADNRRRVTDEARKVPVKGPWCLVSTSDLVDSVRDTRSIIIIKGVR